MYYLQSRYYAPEICRFINADGLASTGQDILGCNMFAYCNNNSVILTDDSGDSSAPFWFFLFMNSDFGLVHYLVQMACTSQLAESKMEIGVYRTDGTYGRADLFADGKVWEVKHKRSSALALPQAISYVGGMTTQKEAITGLGAAGTFEGSFIINCMGESYIVSYYSPTDGVVLYDVQQMESQVKQPKYTYLPFAPKGERLVEGYAATYHAPSTVLGPIPAVSFGFGSGGARFANKDCRLC